MQEVKYPWWGDANPAGGGVTNLVFGKNFGQKLHENERTWTKREGVSLATPLNAPQAGWSSSVHTAKEPLDPPLIT